MMSKKPDYYKGAAERNACSNQNIQHPFENVKRKFKNLFDSPRERGLPQAAAPTYNIQTHKENKGSLCTCFFGVCVDFLRR